MATKKQIKYLERLGMRREDAEKLTVKEASIEINDRENLRYDGLREEYGVDEFCDY